MESEEHEGVGQEAALDESFVAAATAVRADPSDDGAWDSLEEHAAAQNSPDDVSALYREVLAGDLATEVAPGLAQRAVQFHEEWCEEDSPLLVEVLQRVLQVDPTASEWAFQRLTVVYTVAERWDEVLDLYDREIEGAVDAFRRATLLEEAAQTAKDFAGAPERAIGYLQRLLPLRPGDRQLLAGLQRLLERYERHEDLIALWRQQLPRQSAEQARGMRLQIAQRFFEGLGRPGDALAELRDLLSDAEADNAEPMAMLEAIANNEALEAESRREALTLLRERYAAEGRQTDVIGTLSTALALADGDEQVSLHRDAAQRLEEQGKAVDAMEQLSAVLRLTGDDEQALEGLRRIAGQAGEARRLVDILVLAADAAEQVGARAALRLEAAQRLIALGEPAAAVPQLTLLAQTEGVAQSDAVEAARLGESLLREAERQPEQLSMLERLVELEPAASDRRAALGRAARLASDLGEVDRALGLWEQGLSLNAHDAEALGAMVDILDEAERPGDLVSALHRRAAGPVSPWQRRADLTRIAQVQAEELSHLDEAIATWLQVAGEFGEDAQVSDALGSLFERTARWEELASVLERTAQREDVHLAAVRARQGDVYAARLERAPEAVGAYSRALQADPSHAAARTGLAVLCDNEAVVADAVEALAGSYRDTDEWQPLLSLLERRFGAAKDDLKRVELLQEAAKLQEERAEDAAGALGSVRRALALAPADQRLEAELLRLAAASEDWQSAADAFGEAAAACEDDAPREAHLRDLEARIREERLGDHSGAFEAGVQALKEAPTRSAFVDRVVRLAKATERLVEAEEILVAVADHAFAPPTHRLALAEVQRGAGGQAFHATLLRIADSRSQDLDALHEATELALGAPEEGGLGDPEVAQGDFERLYARASGLWRRGLEATGEKSAPELSQWAASVLVDRYEEAGELQGAAGLLLDVASLPLEAEQSASLKRRAALLLVRAEEPARAADLLRDVLRITPNDVEAIQTLGQLYAADERHGELLALRRHELSLADDASRRVELRMDIVRIVNAVEAASNRMDVLKANLGEHPGHRESISAIEALLSRRRAFDTLADILSEQAAEVEPVQSAELWGRVAELSESQLSDADRALEAHRKVVDHEPSNLTALDALARIHTEREEPAAASRWLERRLTVAEDGERADLSLALAQALIAAGRNERAAKVLAEARETAPERVDLRDLLVAQYRAREAWQPLAAVLADAAQRATAEDEVLGFAREAASLYGERIGEPAGAIPVLRRALELVPADRPLQLQLAAGLRASGELDEARGILEAVIGDFGRRRSPERAQVHYELGVLARDQGDLDGALEQLELATKMAMAEPRMLQMLGRLAREASQLDRAEKAYRALLMTVRRRGSDANLDVGSAEVLFELHAIAQARGDEEGARGLRESAIEAAAQNDAEAFRFRDALVERGDAALALEGLERRTALAESDASKAQMLAAGAVLLEENLEQPGEAFGRRLQALRLAPSEASIHDALEASGQELGRIDEYLALLEELVGSLQNDGAEELRASLYVRLGAIRERQGGLDEAVGFYSRAESLLPAPLEAWDALARVGAAREDVPLQKRVLGKLVGADGLGEEPRASALHQYAAVLLKDPGSAVEDGVSMARRAFDADPRHASLVDALDGAVGRGDGMDVLRLYEEVARDAGDSALLLRFLERRAMRSDATLVQVREAVERARALRDAGRAETAAEVEDEDAPRPGTQETELPEVADERLARMLARCIEVARASEEGVVAARGALVELAELRADQRRGPEALGLFREAVDTAEGDDERRGLLLRLAALAAGAGNDLEVAAETYASLLEEEPSDEVIWRPLLGVYAAQGDEERLGDLVASLIDALLEPSLRNEARLAQGKFLMEKEGREADVAEILKAALDEEPNHEEAATLLAQLYERSGYDEELVELLERQLDVARDNQELEKIAELSLKLGGLLEKVRRDDAMDVYRRALEWVPQERPIIEAFLALFTQEDDPREYAEVREKLLSTETGAAASQLSRELCAQWDALEDASGVIRALALGYAGNPEDAELREVLEARYRHHEMWEELAEFLRHEAERLAEDPEAAVGRLLESAALRRERLGDAAGAVAMLRQAQETQWSLSILEELVAALRANGEPDAAAGEVSGALEQEGHDASATVRLLLLRGQLKGEGGDVHAEVADYEEAYTLRAADAAPALVDALRRARTGADAETERVLVMRLVVVLEASGDADSARAELSAWTDAHTDDREALMRLRDVDVSRQDWEGVIVTASRLLGLVEGEEQVAAVMLLADAAASAGAPERARQGLEQVAAIQAGHPQIVERLRGLYEQIGAHRELAGLMVQEAEVAAAEDAEAAFELFRKAGSLLIDHVGDAEAALPALARAAQLKPDDHQTIVLLADSYTGAGYFAEAGQLLEQAISNHPRRRSPELSQLQHRMARLARAAGDRELEMQWLAAALESDKNNGYAAAELAHLAWELGDLDTALGALRAVTLSRNEGPMSRAAAFLMQARIAHQRGEARRALLWARKAKQEDPELDGADAFLAQLGDG